METIVIGNATLYLGDAYEILPIIGPVDAMVTDPPYEFNNSGGGKFRKARHASNEIVKTGLDKGFDHSFIKPELYKSVVLFCHDNQLCKLLPYFNETYDRHKLLFWWKSNPSPMANKSYLADVEPYIHAWQMGSHPIGTYQDLKRVVPHQVGKSVFDHPTVKPDVVMDKIMRNVNGETVIDPFAGTGSTGVAAIKAGKKFIGIERDPKFFNIMVGRLLQAHIDYQTSKNT